MAEVSAEPIRSQLIYSRRNGTFPIVGKSAYSNHSTLPGPNRRAKSIKSLNIPCLSKILKHLDYKDLFNCRLVCYFWKEAVDYQLVRRTHFTYGKALNSWGPGPRRNRRRMALINNIYLNPGFASSCEKCMALQTERSDEAVTAVNEHHSSSSVHPHHASSNFKSNIHERSPSMGHEIEEVELGACETDSERSFGPSSSGFGSSGSFGASPMSFSPVPYCEIAEEQRCSDCQAMLKDLRRQIEEEEADEHEEEEDAQDYYNDYVDFINMDLLERFLAKMPRLYSLKFAQGYRYGRLRQTCLEVSGVALLWRTYALCPNLTKIDLSNVVGLSTTEWSQLGELYGGQLYWLNVSGTRLDEVQLRAIVKGCHKLRYLNIANNFAKLEGGCLEMVSDKLETIVLDYSQNVRALDGLLQGRGRHIIELEANVGFCFNPSMAYRLIGTHLRDLMSLKIIFKSYGERKPPGLFRPLAELPELESLHLIEEIDDFDSSSSLDDESVLIILRALGPKLRELHLHCSSSLFGGPSCLTDRSIGEIDQLAPNLEVLSIKRAAITDKSLSAIGRLRNAHTVELIDLESISDSGVVNIIKSFRTIEQTELETLSQKCGVDLNLSRESGPKIEKLTRSGSLCDGAGI